MSHTQTTTCSNLLASYKKWGRSLEITKEALKVFEESGSEGDYENVTAAIGEAKVIQHELQTVWNAPAVFQGHVCRTHECMALEMIFSLLDTESTKIHLSIQNGQVFRFDVSGISSSNMTNILSITAGLFTTLRDLDCSYIKANKIPQLPDSLLTFNCSYNSELTELPPLPPRLVDCFCHNTNLQIFPILPDTVEVLSIGHTKITSIPSLPPFLTTLSIEALTLSTLPKLPDSLGALYCSGSKIETLPELPPSLYMLNMTNTKFDQDVEFILKLQAQGFVKTALGTWERE